MKDDTHVCYRAYHQIFRFDECGRLAPVARAELRHDPEATTWHLTTDGAILIGRGLTVHIMGRA